MCQSTSALYISLRINDFLLLRKRLQSPLGPARGAVILTTAARRLFRQFDRQLQHLKQGQQASAEASSLRKLPLRMT